MARGPQHPRIVVPRAVPTPTSMHSESAKKRKSRKGKLRDDQHDVAVRRARPSNEEKPTVGAQDDAALSTLRDNEETMRAISPVNAGQATQRNENANSSAEQGNATSSSNGANQTPSVKQAKDVPAESVKRKKKKRKRRVDAVEAEHGKFEHRIVNGQELDAGDSALPTAAIQGDNGSTHVKKRKKRHADTIDVSDTFARSNGAENQVNGRHQVAAAVSLDNMPTTGTEGDGLRTKKKRKKRRHENVTDASDSVARSDGAEDQGNGRHRVAAAAGVDTMRTAGTEGDSSTPKKKRKKTVMSNANVDLIRSEDIQSEQTLLRDQIFTEQSRVEPGPNTSDQHSPEPSSSFRSFSGPPRSRELGLSVSAKKTTPPRSPADEGSEDGLDRPASSFEPPLPQPRRPKKQDRNKDDEGSESDARGNSRSKNGTQTSLSIQQQRTLQTVMQDYGREHGFSDDDLVALIAGNGTTPHLRSHAKTLWGSIYKAFPEENNRFLRRKVKRLRGRVSQDRPWSQADDNQLVDLVSKYGKTWQRIGAVMDRHGDNCRDRYRNHAVCGGNKIVGKWSAEETNLLLESVRKAIQEEGGSSVARNVYINWSKVSALMDGNRSRQQCMKKWEYLKHDLSNPTVLRLLFGDPPNISAEVRMARMHHYSMSDKDKVEVIRAIATQETDDRYIGWENLRDGHFTAKFAHVGLVHFWWTVRQWKGMPANISDKDLARHVVRSLGQGDLPSTYSQLAREKGEEEEGIVAKGHNARLLMTCNESNEEESDRDSSSEEDRE